MSPGRLVLVGTPIGNLEDLSPRAMRALGEADVIYCEDTRRTRRLLSATNIPAPSLVRLDQHNESSMASALADQVAAGKVVALVSDAGMPTISDPGRIAVKEVSGRGLTVEAVPGPSAVSTALALSGLDAGRYLFLGFLPRKGRERHEALAALQDEPVTVVVYEAPHRVVRTVGDLLAACGSDRPVALARELTKLHEETFRGTLSDAARWLAESGEPRGEWVIVVGPAPGAGARPEPSDADIVHALSIRPGRDAVAEVAAELQVPKRRVYALAVAAKRDSPDPPMP